MTTIKITFSPSNRIWVAGMFRGTKMLAVQHGKTPTSALAHLRAYINHSSLGCEECCKAQFECVC